MQGGTLHSDRMWAYSEIVTFYNIIEHAYACVLARIRELDTDTQNNMSFEYPYIRNYM